MDLLTLVGIFFVIISSLIHSPYLLATPYPDPAKLISIPTFKTANIDLKSIFVKAQSFPSLRIQVDYADNESYKIAHFIKENSGTEALYSSKKNKDDYGSYQAKLVTKDGIYYDSIGTGKEFRRLARSLTFRFPYFDGKGQFSLFAENPSTGKMEFVLSEELDSSSAIQGDQIAIEQRVLREAQVLPSLNLVIYSEGYLNNSQTQFFADAKKVVDVLESTRFPGQERFRISAVFAPSASILGKAQDRGNIPQKKDTFLGLDFPYWNKFGRWYNVVYATNQHQFRTGLAQASYDYPLVLIDSSDYWGVGNYKELTAVPARSSKFSYLLLHEFAHYLGLNEEYEEGGRTELEFAPEIDEPWSQNITFHPTRAELKWVAHTTPGISLPTKAIGSKFNDIGAFRGGYAGSPPARSHKPSLNCIMSSGGSFCPVCHHAILDQLVKDSGE